MGYACYVTIMAKNEALFRHVNRELAKDVRDRPRICVFTQRVCESNVFTVVVYCAIVLNVVTMILLHGDERSRADDFFVCFFCFEALLKVGAYGFFGYWKEPLNTFDGVLVALMILEKVFLGKAMGWFGVEFFPWESPLLWARLDARRGGVSL